MATVNLSAEFGSGGDKSAILGRLAQVVYTLTQFSTVDAVSFELDGQPVTTFGGAGIVLDHPVGRDDYTDQLPAIFMDRPAWGAALTHPGRVSGVANVFEATFQVRLTDAKGAVLVDRTGDGVVRDRLLGDVQGGPRLHRGEGPVRDASRVRPVGEGRQPGEHHRVPGLADAGPLRPAASAPEEGRDQPNEAIASMSRPANRSRSMPSATSALGGGPSTPRVSTTVLPRVISPVVSTSTR